MNKLTELKKKIVGIKNEMRNSGQQVLTESVAELFEQHPDLLAIRWNQYTPGFNDGSPCVHGMNEVHFITQGLLDLAKQDLGDDVDLCEVEPDDYWQITRHWPDVQAFTDFARVLENLEDAWEMVWGTDVTITLTREGIEVCDYDCGY